MNNIRIKDISIYHPTNVVNNKYYYEHFQKKDKDIKHFLKDIMGREDRYIIDDKNENSITMAIKSTEKVLEESKLTGKELDMIVFTTQLPEYTMPSNAIIIHNAIKGRTNCICYDINSNCAGMVVAVEQVSRYMKSNNNIKYALIIGSDHFSVNCDENDEMSYANFGDASCSLILERSEQEGFIDALYDTDSSIYEKVLFPAVGLSNTYLDHTPKSDRKIQWLPFDGGQYMPIAIQNIEQILKENSLTKKDISLYAFSQFCLNNNRIIKDGLQDDEDKFIYIGDKYGYTATSSPFVALYEAIKTEKVKRGEYVIFWTVGTGRQFCTMLFKY